MARKSRGRPGNGSALNDPGIYSNEYYVPKGTGTFSDVLLAYGFAAVLQEILRQAKGPTGTASVLLEDVGSWYRVTLGEPLRPEWVEQCSYFSVAKAVRTGKAKVGGIPEVDMEDTDEAWRQVRAYLSARRAGETASADMETSAAAADLSVLDPRHWTTIFIGTRQMQALGAYNDATRQWWETRDHFTANLRALLALFARPETDSKVITEVWKTAVPVKVKAQLTASQMLNPHQGKGQNRPKADALAMGNVSSFWLLEYLKAAGLWRCAIPRKVSDSDDRKTYVLAPVHLSLGAHEAVFEKFSQRLWAGTAVKMDCLASLLYTEALLEHSEAGQADELALIFGEKDVRDVVGGFHVAHYKLLSRNAYTMINVAFLGLPRWIGPVETRDAVARLRIALEEHRRVLETIDEGQSDGYGLLVRYRDFLGSNRWEDFFNFVGGFAEYLMRNLDEARRQGHRPRVRRFTAANLEVMIMQGNRPLLPIVQTPGFQHIARAIRRSTVTLQYLAQEQGRSALPYEIRYGLGHDLLRKANRSDEFMAAVSAFAQSYNAENARVAEKEKDVWRREAISDQDLDDLVRLVDECGAGTVAHLLVAYGYAREAREETLSPVPSS